MSHDSAHRSPRAGRVRVSASRRRQARRQAATNIENDAPDDHSIGRSRGGLTTKFHALTERRHVPRSWSGLTAGQAGDKPQLVPLLDDYATACPHHGGADLEVVRDRRLEEPPGVPGCIEHQGA